jgi:hypothetical protein
MIFFTPISSTKHFSTQHTGTRNQKSGVIRDVAFGGTEILYTHVDEPWTHHFLSVGTHQRFQIFNSYNGGTHQNFLKFLFDSSN